jgi:hypothetical protein
MRHELSERLTTVEGRLRQIDEAIASDEGDFAEAPEQPAAT